MGNHTDFCTTWNTNKFIECFWIISSYQKLLNKLYLIFPASEAMSSDKSGMEKNRVRVVRVYPNFEMSDSGTSGMEN